MSEIWIKEGLTNIWTFHLTSSGVLITIITVLYSFILSKREQLIFYVNESKTLKNPNVSRKRHFHQKYISKVKQIMAHLQSSVFKLSKDLIDSIHEEGIVAYTS